MEALPKLPEPLLGKARPKIIQSVLLHLAKKRPISQSRETFFLQADAFAMLVKTGSVAMDGEHSSHCFVRMQ